MHSAFGSLDWLWFYYLCTTCSLKYLLSLCRSLVANFVAGCKHDRNHYIMPCMKKPVLISPYFSDCIQVIVWHNHLLLPHTALQNWQRRNAHVFEIKFFNCLLHLRESCFRLDFFSKTCLLPWVSLSWTALSSDFTERHARASGQDSAPCASETRSEKCHGLHPRLLTEQAAAGGGKQFRSNSGRETVP